MHKAIILTAAILALAGCTTVEYYQMLGGFSNENIRIGMTVDEWLAVENRPDRINRTVTEHGVREQWVYRVGQYDTQYVYFENGRIVSYQSY